MLRAASAWFIASAAFASPLLAQVAVIVQPAAITRNSMGESPDAPAANLINQMGLNNPYVSGVTGFDAYVPTALHHANDGFWNSTSSVQSGTMVFDLGAAYYVSAIAQWQHSNFYVQSIKTVTLRADLDGDFSSGAVSLGTFDNLPSPDPQSITLSFPEIQARYIEWTIINYGNGNGTRCNEVAFRVLPTVGTAFCAGDGSSTACPCGNVGAMASGCANSETANGARLGATGTASIGSDSLVIAGDGMPNSSALFFQGTSRLGGGLGTVFGDGLRCAGGAVLRFAPKTNVNGISRYPESGDLSLSVAASLSAGDVRAYQIWYRNAANFCTPSTFNLTNGLSITWGP